MLEVLMLEWITEYLLMGKDVCEVSSATKNTDDT